MKWVSDVMFIIAMDLPHASCHIGLSNHIKHWKVRFFYHHLDNQIQMGITMHCIYFYEYTWSFHHPLLCYKHNVVHVITMIYNTGVLYITGHSARQSVRLIQIQIICCIVSVIHSNALNQILVHRCAVHVIFVFCIFFYIEKIA